MKVGDIVAFKPFVSSNNSWMNQWIQDLVNHTGHEIKNIENGILTLIINKKSLVYTEKIKHFHNQDELVLDLDAVLTKGELIVLKPKYADFLQNLEKIE